ncbi:MAG: ribonuclease E/G, partial [Bryobacteraceae bacterium]
MSKEICISSTPHETRLAIIEDEQLTEVYYERENEYTLAGSIYKGRVTRVLPGMQSAFVDLGLERDTFLYVSDFFEENEDIEPLEDKPLRGQRRERQRNPERAASERSTEQRSPAAAAAVAPEAETSEIETEGLSSAELAADEAAAAAQSRPEGERTFRDHRGRRSRRRRPRGRGFPESKYAQAPGSAAGPPESAGISEEPKPEAADVLILPGESLAKYRRATAGTPLEEARAHDRDLDREAEEIELTDRVFNHRPEDESPEVEEKKLELAREDEPARDFAIPDVDAVGPASWSRVEPSSAASEGAPPAGISDETPGEQPSESDGTMIAGEFEAGEAGEEPTEETLSIESPATAVGEGEAPAQTASVREQGSHYLHRVSRRMRRRRNRPGQAGAEISDTPAGSGGTSPAPAVEPESRPEVQEHAAERSDRPLPSITDLLKSGQEIIVQIAKEPLGQKGARITSHIALPGRYVVYMPTVNHLGVSRRIASEQERHRLKRILQTYRSGTSGGFIVRTAGEGIPEDEIAADMNILYNLWLDIRQKAEKGKAPALLHHDLSIVQRVLRDQLTDEFKAVWVDNEEMYEKVLDFLQKFQPALVSRVKMYTRPAPVFDAFNITQELEKALRPKVWLKSGGYIVINQTEALVAIDINTGKYVGKSNRLEDTIVKT